MPGFDLHVHTSASDGVLSGEEVIKLALQVQLDGIAITDHDTVEGLESAVQLGEEYRLPVIPGIELSTQYENTEVHILGYYLDYSLPWVEEKLRFLQNARIGRIEKIVEKLCMLGYDLNKEEVFALAGKGSVGRPHIAYILLEKGYISSVQEAFHKLIGRGCPAYVPRQKFSPLEAVDFINRAGGVPVMAHPGLSKADNLITELTGRGLVGLEVFHPDHGPDDEDKYLRIASQNKLIVTGGSDFHGSKEGNRFSLGSKTVPADTLEVMRKQIKRGNYYNESF